MRFGNLAIGDVGESDGVLYVIFIGVYVENKRRLLGMGCSFLDYLKLADPLPVSPIGVYPLAINSTK